MLVLKQQWYKMLTRQRQWLNVLLFVVLIRLLLLIPALFGANGFSLSESVSRGGFNSEPRSLPGVWARWDSGYYLEIAAEGYSFHGDETAFFPAYPLLIRSVAVGQRAWMLWSGFLISNLAFVLGALLLWCQVERDHNESVAWGTIITLSVFPTSFFFSAIYTESLFLLFSILVYWFSVRKQYVLAGLFVAAASVTRVTGLLLVFIPLVEILMNKPSRFWLQVAATTFISGIGLSLYGLYMWVTQGSLLVYVLAQSSIMKRMITWPWKTVFDSLAVVISGYGGFRDNWFMRVVSTQDLLATLLFVGCAALAFFLVRKSLFAYSVVAILVLLVSHGPYTLGLFAVSRYVLGLFPGFIVLGVLLDRTRVSRLKWGVWAISSILLFFLTAWFANGRWVA